MKLIVIIESPFKGATLQEWEHNLAYARAALRDSIQRGEVPLASHLLYTQPGVLDDGIPEERELGIQLGLEMRHVASLSAVYTDLGISNGMKVGIQDAERHLRRIVYRSLPGWSKES